MLIRFLWKKLIFEANYSERLIFLVHALTRVILLKRSPNEENTLLVDIGSGTGGLSMLVAKEAAMIPILIDIRGGAIEEAPLTSYRIVADAHSLPIRNTAIDVVMAISLIEHLQDYRVGLYEMARIVKPKGLIIIQIPNLNFYIEFHTAIPLPMLVPKQIKNAILKKFFGYFINWNITMKTIFKTLDIFSPNILIYKYNYPPTVASRLLRKLYLIFKPLLRLNPEGYIIIAEKGNSLSY